MQPIKFAEVNAVLAENQPQYKPLPIFRSQLLELTEEEIATVIKTKRIYHSHMTFGKPPMPIFLAVSKKDILNNVEEEFPAVVPFTIYHNTSVGLGWRDRLRVLFGKAIHQQATILVNAPIEVLKSPPATCFVEHIFTRKGGVEQVVSPKQNDNG